MPNTYIRYNGTDRPYVQYTLQELQAKFDYACLEKDSEMAHEIHCEASHRRTKKAVRFCENVEYLLDFF